MLSQLARKTLALLLLLAPPLLKAQDFSQYLDSRKLQFGIYAGYGSTSSRVQTGQFPNFTHPNNPLYSVDAVNGNALELGILIDQQLVRFVSLRLIPMISLQERYYDFTFQKGVERRTVDAPFFQLPLLVKWKSDVYDNFRVYLTTGPMMAINLQSDSKVLNDPKLIKFDKYNFCWVVGFGMDFYTDRSIVCPEIKYCFGLKNMYVPINQDIPGAIGSILTGSLIFSLTIY